MQTGLIPEKRDALGRMLADFLAGDKKAFLQVDSPSLEMSEMMGATLFRSEEGMSDLERKALDLCSGRVLDVGGGSGCHSLVLQARGLDVHAIDISPGCVRVMTERGVARAELKSLFNISSGDYDTVLMLMNGIGLAGTIEGLNYFFQYIRKILVPGGQILADSTDLSSRYTSLPIGREDRYYGETEFTMSYGNIQGEPFEWLYIDFSTLAFYARFHGWQCKRVVKDADGKYLARIY